MTVLVDNYVRQVELACADLPDEQRRRIVADLAAHLREVDTEAGSIYAELGPPAEYAQELRAALDLPPSPPQYSPTRFFRLPRRTRTNDLIIALVAALLVLVVVIVVIVATGSRGDSGPAAPTPAPAPTSAFAPSATATASARPTASQQTLPLPSVVGLNLAQARQALLGRGLQVQVVTVHGGSGAVSGTVITQEPVAGTVVVAGTLVTLDVAT